MPYRRFVGYSGVKFVLLWLASACFSHPAIGSAGTDWLAEQQQPDGSIASVTDKNTPFEGTGAVLVTLGDLGLLESSQVDVDAAGRYLVSNVGTSSYRLSLRLSLADTTGEDPAGLSASIDNRLTRDGGISPFAGFDAAVADTARALLAFGRSGSAESQVIGEALLFLTDAQRPDGGFSYGPANQSSIYLTALAADAMAAYRDDYSGVEESLAAARAFLVAALEADHLWGEDFVSARVLLALAHVDNGAGALLTTGAASLRDRQLPDGSWGGDVFGTALALRALRAVDELGNVNSSTGAIAGRVVLGGIAVPLDGITVALSDTELGSVEADATGRFFLPSVPEGRYTLVTSGAGFRETGVVADVHAGQVLDLGDIPVRLLDGRGLLKVSALDQSTDAGVTGAALSFQGPSSETLITGADGTAGSSGLTAGIYDFEVTKDGFRALSGSVSVAAGVIQNLIAPLVPEGASLNDGDVALYGQVVDGSTGSALNGVSVSLQETGQVATSNQDGRFSMDPVPRGTYHLSVSANGYASTTVTVQAPAGASGDLGRLSLYPVSQTDAPDDLTLELTVVDELGGEPVASALVEAPDFAISGTTDSAGEVVLEGIPEKTVSLQVTADGYEALSATIRAQAFGEYQQQLTLQPSGDATATSVTLEGTVTDDSSSEPIPQALVTASTGESTTTDANGGYVIGGISETSFDVAIEAEGYDSKTLPVQLATFGTYTLDATLEPYGDKTITVDMVDAPDDALEPDSVAGISAKVTNRSEDSVSVLVIGEIRDGSGALVDSFSPIVAGTGETKAQFNLAADETISLSLPWSVHQTVPGNYRAVVRLVEPGSLTRNNPRGFEFDEGGDALSVAGVGELDGRPDFSPPLIQAGIDTPVSMSVLLRNTGNIPIVASDYELTITNPEDGAVLLERAASADELQLSALGEVDFGEWTPETPGNLQVAMLSVSHPEYGSVTGTLYVGNKATAEFVVDPDEVGEGTRTVHGSVNLEGVDVTQGVSTDPLFDLVKEAVSDGAAYVAPHAIAWHKSHRCLGCHIQTQSAFGLSSSLDKASVNEDLTQELVNYIASSQQQDGGLRIARRYETKSQTALGLWALSAYPEQSGLLGTELDALKHLYERRSVSGDETYWISDNRAGYLIPAEGINALIAQGAARVLRNAADLGTESDTRYEWAKTFTLNTGRTEHFYDSVGYDGKLYVVAEGGKIFEFDPDTGNYRLLPGSGGYTGWGRSIAVDSDGTLYVVGDFSRLLEVSRDGARQVVRLPAHYDYYGVAVAPDGRIFVSRNDSKLLQVAEDGSATVVAEGGLLNNPRDLQYLSDGRLLIANHRDYDILAWEPQKGLSVWANGLAYKPVNLLRTEDGNTYVSTYKNYSDRQLTWEGLLRIRPNGVVTRILTGYRFLGIGVVGGELYAPYFNKNEIRRVGTYNDRTILDKYRGVLPRMARHAVTDAYRDERMTLRSAFRLIAMSEAREFVSDSALVENIDRAIQHLAELLRNRQRSDGGWAKYTYYGISDPFTTAWVGIALDYTDPSSGDQVIRHAIEYLLSTQSADGSWPNRHGYFTTRLASTSLVMAYLPKALERLGGLDLNLDLSFAQDVQPSGFSMEPTESEAGADGSSSYGWDLQGVTSSGREIDFDLSLQDMQLFEDRPAAKSARLTFDNSFTGEAISTPIEIPTVRAVSSLLLDGSTDKPTYQANEPVAVDALVTNTGPDFSGGELRYSIVPASGGEVIAGLEADSVPALAHGEQVPLAASWNTGTALAGDYVVQLRLYDDQGRLRAKRDLPFTILATGELAASSIHTDQPVYEAWDQVALTSRVSNDALNAVLSNSLARVLVEDPGGNTLLSRSIAVDELVPGAYRDFVDSLTLSDAMAGEYTASIRVFNASGDELLSVSSTSFKVRRTPLQAIAGKVTASADRVYQGDPIICTETVSNRAASQGLDATVISELVSMDTEAVVQTESRSLQLAGEGTDARTWDIDTGDLDIGGYACRLLVKRPDGTEQLLDYALFTVLEPPIRINASFDQPLGIGRVLIMLDQAAPAGESSVPAITDDPFGPDGAPTLSAQRRWLTGVLDEAGWSYTIVDNGDDFARELRSGAYRAYAVFSERVKLPVGLQKELREAVVRGESLLVAGPHDDRNGFVFDALGIKQQGDLPDATGLSVGASPLQDAVDIPLRLAEQPQRIRLEGASTAALYEFPGSRGSETAEPAETYHAYGIGAAIYGGFDLLAEGAQAGPDSAFAQLLLDALGYAYPVTAPYVGQPMPVRLSLQNEGIAVSGQVRFELPQGVALLDASADVGDDPAAPGWLFDLDVDAARAITLWLSMPDEPGDLEADIQVERNGVLEDFDRLSTTVPGATPMDPAVVHAALGELANEYPPLKQIPRDFEQGLSAFNAGNYRGALEAWLEVADRIEQQADPADALEARAGLARMIRLAERQLWVGGMPSSGSALHTKGGEQDQCGT